MSAYGPLARALHHLALGPMAMRELSFDLDRKLGGAAPSASGGPVFVTGLARSGTSILLRTLYATERFRTLTYRHMPFVLAPRLWGRFAARHGQAGAAQERAHGDGLAVDFESPEAFEEVFWLTFAGDRYLRRDRLVPHAVDPETGARLRHFIAAIAAGSRYLSKNNNNILRLAALRGAVPEAAIVVPFREPVTQAASLRRQHRNFKQRLASDPFGRRYMRWLGHFEFGPDHRPFDLQNAADRLAGYDPDGLDYWLVYWTAVYEAVLAADRAAPILFDHDALCADPAGRLAALFEALALDADPAAAATGIATSPAAAEGNEADPAVLERARTVHARLAVGALDA